jgi:formate dehydrogenase subunit gamma
MTDLIRRFSKLERVEHLLTMLLFIALAVTGFPQKFQSASASQAVVDVLGGVGMARLLHRVTGVLFALLLVRHLLGSLVSLVRRRGQLSMVPAKKDFSDAVITLRYYLGLSRVEARFDRYDYRQKFEYWGLVFGGVVMVVTGLVLLFPVVVTYVLPGQIVPAAKLAHSSEGLLAFLIIIVWHIYNSHLNPDVFPFDPSIFTGYISRHRMEKEHPLELERLERHEPREP